jgi:hypothetical protein
LSIVKTTAAEALTVLKKIVAGKGRLQGNFYFAGDTKGTAGLVITLSGRDPRGTLQREAHSGS